MENTNIKVGDILTIDGDPNAKATVIEKGNVGVYILTADRCKIPFTWEELKSRKAQVVTAELGTLRVGDRFESVSGDAYTKTGYIKGNPALGVTVITDNGSTDYFVTTARVKPINDDWRTK